MCNLPKFRLFRLKIVILFATASAVYMTLFLHLWYKKSHVHIEPLVLPYVMVHLDLKGTPLKLSYLEKLLPRLKENGANSLLMEYEDMFPYEGRLVNLSAESCYRKSELKKFLTLAKDLGFEVIPLVQTFGHMEHVLKLAEFQHLREVPQHPDSICPSNADTTILLKNMIQQVMQFHASITPLKFIHIGCDEVFNMNKCQNCVQRNASKLDIFLRHVKTLSDIVKSLNADTTVLIWDDMLRGIKPNQWKHIDYFHNVQPVYWDYQTSIEVTHINLMMYHNKFKNIWIASAFKGADGRTATFPVINNRFSNLLDWMFFIQTYKFGGETGVYNFEGIILTGWSRYSHMDPPCELLPVAYPSLIINLLLIQKFKTGEISKQKNNNVNKLETFVDKFLSQKTLKCEKNGNGFNESHCKFEGHHLYNVLAKYEKLGPVLSENMDDLGVKYFEYYSEVGVLNTNKILLYITSVNSTLQARKLLETLIKREMSKYYEEDFVTEYVNFKTYYEKKITQNTLVFLNNYSKVQSWPRRSKTSSYYEPELPKSIFQTNLLL